MSIEILSSTNKTMSLGLIGDVRCRTVEVAGFTNTIGEKEVYRICYRGTYNDNSIRADVMVQRKNGRFAMLNHNRHQMTIRRVLSVAKQEGIEADYREYLNG